MFLIRHLSSCRRYPIVGLPLGPHRTSRLWLEELEPRQLLTILPAPTTSSVGVIEDELTYYNPSPEVTFAATHTDGTQKLPSYQNALYTSINPNWFMLHYQLATELSKYDYIINNTWAQDLTPALPDFYINPAAGPGGVTSHENWFEHSNGSLDPSTTGNRLVAPDGSLLANIDDPGWRQYEATTLVQNLLASGAQGVFADGFTGPVSGFYVKQGDKRYDYGGPIPGPADPSLWPDGQTWIDSAVNYISYIQGILTTVGEALYGPGKGFAYVPNVGQMDTGWADIDYSAAKGVFAEGFSDFYGMITDQNWTMSMDRALRITSTSDPRNADRMFIMQPYLTQTPDSPQGLQERSWVFGSYLLLKGDHSYVNMYGGRVPSRLEWYPEYQVNLGAPQDPGGMPLTVDGYYDPASQLYRRYFQNGIVLLNNSNTPQVYNLGQVMQQVIVNGWGGGVRPGDIDPATNSYVAGWLSSQLVNTVTVGPYSSVILINQGIPIQAPPPGGGAGTLPPFRIPESSGPSISIGLASGEQTAASLGTMTKPLITSSQSSAGGALSSDPSTEAAPEAYHARSDSIPLPENALEELAASCTPVDLVSLSLPVA